MSLKVKNDHEHMAAQQGRSMEWAYRSLLTSSQQKLFQTVLGQAQSSAEENYNQEFNSLQKELNSWQLGDADLQNIDLLEPKAPLRPAEKGGLSSLATSALLNLVALARQGNGSRIDLPQLAGLATPGLPVSGTDYAMLRSTLQGKNPDSKSIGDLSARFESGNSGAGTIGHDERGGTSYGVYQIASETGTMDRFLDFLEEHAPQWAQRLRNAGPANTGSTEGGMPSEWKRIAAADPARFAELQHDFIEATHYSPALEEINHRTGVNLAGHPKAVQEVLWSTAVQHGAKGAANIFCKAIDSLNPQGQEIPTRDLIDQVYTSRATKFGLSTRDIRTVVQNRFKEEKAMALSMLSDDPARTGVHA